jgi:hypothetical protein
MKTLTSVLLASLLVSSLAASAQQQDASQTPANPSPEKQPSSSVSTSPAKPKRILGFLIIGTVFNETALSFPGVQVRVRQAGDKKYRWQTYTNSRGEFAVRVPPGYDYEVTVHMKKYADQTKTVDSKADVQQRLSIQLEPLGQAKAGAKP